MSTFKLLAITDRDSCPEDLERRILRLAASDIDALILRVKDLPPQAYLTLAEQTLDLCRQQQLPLILHRFADACQQLNNYALHLSYPQLVQQPQVRLQIQLLGVSVHSLAEARQAAALGADYLIAGHIFPTACKQGLPGRGLEFLHAVCSAVTIPVYAIGGITPANIGRVQKAGASGACLMSSLMASTDPTKLVQLLRQTLNHNASGIQKARF